MPTTALRAALFRTEKLNAREPDPNNTLLNVLAGTQRVNGAQIEARGRILSLWDVLSSYTYLDAKIVRSNFYPAAIGARLANVPANSLSIWSNIRPGRGRQAWAQITYPAGQPALRRRSIR